MARPGHGNCISNHLSPFPNPDAVQEPAMTDNPDIGAPAPAWKRLRFEATAAAAEEPSLSGYLNAAILNHVTLGQALSYHLA